MFDLLCHRLVDALVVIGDALLPGIRACNSFDDSFTAGFAVCRARPGPTVSHHVLALGAPICVPVLGQVAEVDSESSWYSRSCCLGGRGCLGGLSETHLWVVCFSL